MKKTKILAGLLAAVMAISIPLTAGAARVPYLPDVTEAMSDPAYWCTDERVLMTWDEIQGLNDLTIAADGTGMYDLKNQAETVDGVNLNKMVKSSSQADAAYYLGWTYLGTDTKATQKDFDKMIRNTQNPKATTDQAVRYGVAVHRTTLRTFPSEPPIWDDPKDPDFNYQHLVGLRVNEPIVITSVSADGKYYLAKSICCSGWVPAQDVAVCRDKEEWLSAWDLAPEDTLVVYGDKVYTEKSNYSPITSQLLLTMGTTLELAVVEDPNELIDNRAPYQNHVVWMPIRNEDGSYAKKKTLISEHAKVSEGYLDLSGANIASVALEALGNTYGWGGSLLSEDCSAYIRNIYKCFGLELARNTTWQQAMPMAKVDMTNMCLEEREDVMAALPLGSVLFFSGHEMLYLGSENGEDYVISAVSKIKIPGQSGTQRIRSVILNTLDIQRANGLTWLEALTAVNVPYWGLVDGAEYDLPAPAWYHDGVAYCMTNKIMQPYEDGYFHLEGQVTRAMAAQILYNLEGKPAVEGENPFRDVAEDAWYRDAVTWAAEAGVMTGYNDTVFGPNAPLTREQMAAVLYRYGEVQGLDLSAGETADLSGFADARTISPWAEEAMAWAVGTGILEGSNGRLTPKGDATRAQCAVIFMRYGELGS
ncbi:MAG: SH3 domain-containing protein [Ruminiclostridium sp.]|nr:SH3 domain-containing protein [Ruminiclostridium sp.]